MLRQLRETVGISQKQLAEKLGKTQAVISMWESNKTRPKYDTLSQLAEILQVSEQTIIDCFKGGKNEHS